MTCLCGLPAFSIRVSIKTHMGRELANGAQCLADLAQVEVYYRKFVLYLSTVNFQMNPLRIPCYSLTYEALYWLRVTLMP